MYFKTYNYEGTKYQLKHDGYFFAIVQKKIFDKFQSTEHLSFYCPDSAYFSRTSPLDFQTVALSVLKLFKKSAEIVSSKVPS